MYFRDFVVKTSGTLELCNEVSFFVNVANTENIHRILKKKKVMKVFWKKLF